MAHREDFRCGKPLIRSNDHVNVNGRGSSGAGIGTSDGVGVGVGSDRVDDWFGVESEGNVGTPGDDDAIVTGVLFCGRTIPSDPPRVA